MRKLLSLVVTITGLLIFVGCGCSEDTDELESRISDLELNIIELETQLYQSEIQCYQLYEESEEFSSCYADYKLLAGTIFDELHLSTTIGLRRFEDDDEILRRLEVTNHPSLFGYTYFDFNLPPWENTYNPSRAAFFQTINTTIVDYGEAFGADLKVVIEHEEEIHYAYFFSGNGFVRLVMPYAYFREQNFLFHELALLVVVSDNSSSNTSYLITFDGDDIEILHMQPEAIQMP